jgi:hypothetical protein
MTRIVRPIAKSALPSSIIVRMHPRIRNNFSLFGKGDRGHEVETDPRPASGVRFRDDCAPNAIIEPIHRKANAGYSHKRGRMRRVDASARGMGLRPYSVPWRMTYLKKSWRAVRPKKIRRRRHGNTAKGNQSLLTPEDTGQWMHRVPSY